jgi:LPXTG-motif cell wall-anchored protein
MVRVGSVCVVLMAWLVVAAPASAQQVQIRITSPANGGVVAGPDVTVSIAVTGTTLVPVAEATRLEDLHVHYLLDVDPAPYLSGSTPVAQGDPHQVHSAALSNTFADVAPGQHRVTVLLGLSSHVARQPVVAPSVTFRVAGAGQVQVPAQLPRTGDLDGVLGVLLGAGAIGVLAGTILRRRSR